MTEKTDLNIQGAACPLPLPKDEQIVMGHGSGGKMMHELIQKMFLPAFENPMLNAGNDAAGVQPNDFTSLAISTDAHVVSPLFFPGGDIGRLAICGTVNDVAMLGATPLYLTASFILEEGLPMDTLQSVLNSMRIAAEEAGIQVVAGDTKVVEKGKADGLYISTCGIGILQVENGEIDGCNAQPGDKVILSGTIGDHGIAVLAARGDLGFEADIESDVAPLNGLIESILDCSANVHVLRDPTRGGLGTTLNEIARQSEVGIVLEERKIMVHPVVQSACEMLGFDPLYVANEGKLVAIVAAEDADIVLDVMQQHPYGTQACIIGEVQPEPLSTVLMKTLIGSHRIVDTLTGEMLPRIC